MLLYTVGANIYAKSEKVHDAPTFRVCTRPLTKKELNEKYKYVRACATPHAPLREGRRRNALLKPPGQRVGRRLETLAELRSFGVDQASTRPRPACEQLAPRVVLRCIRRGTVVYKEGDAPDYFHSSLGLLWT